MRQQLKPRHENPACVATIKEILSDRGNGHFKIIYFEETNTHFIAYEDTAVWAFICRKLDRLQMNQRALSEQYTHEDKAN